MASPGLTAAINRSFKAFATEEIKAGRRAATRGMQATINGSGGLKLAVRQDVLTAGLGQRVANAVRGVVYPKQGESLNPSGTVYSNAPHIMDSFTRGSLIRARNATLLAIPTKECPRGRGGRRMTPKEAAERFGYPGSVPIGRGRFLLVYRATQSKSGRFNTTLNRKRAPKGVRAIAFFILVPRAQMPKKLSPDAALAAAGAALPRNVALAWPETA